MSPRAPATLPSSCWAAFSLEWAIWVFLQFTVLPLSSHPADQNPANSVCVTAFPVCMYCWAELSSWILHLGCCNIISLALATVIWPVLCISRILPLKGFVALHLTGNQPAFDSFICVISVISCMSWKWTSVMQTHFPPLKPSLKCRLFHAYKKLTVFHLLICENCSSLLLAVTLPAPCAFIYCAFSILVFSAFNAFYTWVLTSLKQVFAYSHLSCSLRPPEGRSLVGCRELHVFTASLSWIKIAFFLNNGSQMLLPVPQA